MAGLGFASDTSRASSEEKIGLVNCLADLTGIYKATFDNFSYQELSEMKKDIVLDPWKYWDRQKGLTVFALDKCAVNNAMESYEAKPSRLCALYREVLMKCTYDSGHTYTFDYLFYKGLRLTDKQVDYVEEKLCAEGVISLHKGKIYNNALVYSESQIAQTIISLLGKTTNLIRKDGEVEDYKILEPEQKEVVDSIATENFMIMTGYPGTGKTKTVSVIAKMYEDVLLVAPTGKAARRITEMCGLEARTVHSIVFAFEINGGSIKDCLIIIDEASMLDIDIAGKFFSRIDTDTCKVLIVGDTCQLPSVGPGQILKDITENDLCEEGIYKHVHLTEIKRQEPGSIILSAHAIAAGKDLIKGDDKRVQVFYPNGKTLQEVVEMAALSDKWRRAQYLTVLREKCSDIINPIIQDFVNPGKGKWRVGDKVIHLKNDRERNVMNGDMGEIISVNKFGFLAKYSNAEYFYTAGTQWMVSLAYAFTVHKSQGSEFDKVILFLNKSRMTNRNILYTGLTRAVNNVLIIADDEDVVFDAIDTVEKSRNTTLRFWLRKYAKELVDGVEA